MNNDRRKQLHAINDEVADLRARVQELLDQEQEAFDAPPENLQESERGEKMQSAIDALEGVTGSPDDAEQFIEEATA